MNHRNFKKTIVASTLATLIYAAAPAMAAESFGGTVKGYIAGANNQALSNATIVLTHKEKGITKTITTNENGEYILRKLPVGEYKMTITKDGFETIERDDVFVTIGSSLVLNSNMYQAGSDVERIIVRGASIARVDVASSTGGIVMTANDLANLPVDKGFENIALLAPGSGKSTEFGANSIGGSSSAENSYYLNGLNVTTIRRGIGSIDLPWEAISQTNIQTGGIDPEFGGALGGIVNAVSKSGSNDFEFGAQLRMQPNALRSQHDDILFLADGTVATATEDDEESFTEASIWASGALIEDTLFAYALFAPQNNDYVNAYQTRMAEGEDKSNRWFAKLDWFINDDHSVEFTSINYANKGSGKNYAYDSNTHTRGEESGIYRSKDGGKVYGLTYTGHLSDSTSLSVIYGRTSEEVFNTATNRLPSVVDDRAGAGRTLSQHSDADITDAEYIRDQLRVDFSWDLDDHSLKFGIDSYDISVDYLQGQNGIGDARGWWTIGTAGADDRSGQVDGGEYIERRRRDTFTKSNVKSTAFYAQDSWQATDNLVLNLGVRYSNIANTVSDGRNFVDIKGQIAPRLQAIYDINGDGSSKVFATFGRYFQPVSVNMNIKQGSTQREVMDYYELGQVDSDGVPVLTADGSPSRGDLLRDTFVRQEGIDDPYLIASSNLKGMYNDEFTLGFEQELMDGDMSWGVRAISRELKRSLEDSDIAPVLAKYFEANGIEDKVGQSSYYILFNPGADVQMQYDFDKDGTVDTVNLSADELGFPEASRKYYSVEFTLKGQATEKLNIDASYTWAHSYGMTEGLVRTDNGQADPGWTTSYDYADLMDHGYGNLPNDRRHSIKIAGSYQLTDDLLLGFSSRTNSGHPKNKFGYHPVGVDTCAAGSVWEDCVSQWYGASSFYDAEGNPAPRGSAGTTPWTTEIDMSLLYSMDIGDNALSFKASVYNLLNSDTTTSTVQRHAKNKSTSEVNPEYGRTLYRLDGRYVSLDVRYEF